MISVLVAHPERVYAESLSLALRADPRIDATLIAIESEPLAAQLGNVDVALLAGRFCSEVLRKGAGSSATKAILLCPDSQLDGQLLLSALRARARGLASTGDSIAGLVAVVVGVAAFAMAHGLVPPLTTETTSDEP